MNPETSLNLQDSDWRSLYRSIERGKCILLLGPHVATYLESDQDRGLLASFSQKLCVEMEREGIAFDTARSNELQYTALRWLKGKTKRVEDLRAELQYFFDQNTLDTPAMHEVLAQLPFSLVVNTSPDHYMQQAFFQANKQAQQEHYNYQRNSSPLIPPIQEESPLVFNLFGSYNDLESLVITKLDRLLFLSNLLKDQSTLPTTLMEHFSEDKTYICIGFNPNDWHLPLLFHSLRLNAYENKIFCLYENQVIPAQRFFYEDSFQFRFVAQNALTFSKELLTGFEAWKTSSRRPPAVAAKEQLRPYVDKPQGTQSGRCPIVLLTAHPTDSPALQLNKEINAVKKALAIGERSKRFSLRPVLDIQKDQLLDRLLRFRPQILHFSGHGDEEGNLLFYSQFGTKEEVDEEGLARLLKEFEEDIGCVVLNACYTESQAQAISRHIPNVIGTDSAIGDTLAIQFSKGFYTSLFEGESYESAYRKAMAEVGLSNFPPGGRPVFYKQGKRISHNPTL